MDLHLFDYDGFMPGDRVSIGPHTDLVTSAEWHPWTGLELTTEAGHSWERSREDDLPGWTLERLWRPSVPWFREMRVRATLTGSFDDYGYFVPGKRVNEWVDEDDSSVRVDVREFVHGYVFSYPAQYAALLLKRAAAEMDTPLPDQLDDGEEWTALDPVARLYPHFFRAHYFGSA